MGLNSGLNMGCDWMQNESRGMLKSQKVQRVRG